MVSEPSEIQFAPYDGALNGRIMAACAKMKLKSRGKRLDHLRALTEAFILLLFLISRIKRLYLKSTIGWSRRHHLSAQKGDYIAHLISSLRRF